MKLGAEATLTLVAIAKAGDTHDLPFPKQAESLRDAGLVSYHPNTGWYLTSQGRVACQKTDSSFEYADFGKHTPCIEQLIAEYTRRLDEDRKNAKACKDSNPYLAHSYRTRALTMTSVITDLKRLQREQS